MNDFLTALSSRFTEENEPREGEYLGEDSLLYCEKCRTPVQCWTNIGGTRRKARCLCSCEEERQRELDEQLRLIQRQMRIAELKSHGIQDRHLLDWRFDAAQETRSIQMARKYVAHWEEARSNNLGLLFWGGVGVGKSFTAACIANALLEQGVPVLMTNFSKILNQMTGLFGDKRGEYAASLSHYELLIIDDLGIERNTEYALEQVYGVVDERYKSGLPLIVTTNLTVTDLRKPQDVAHARIYSRVLEMCTPVMVDGADRREAIGASKQELVKSILM